MNELKSYSDYCSGFNSNIEEDKVRALLLLCLRSNLLNIVEFDMLSGEVLPQGLVDIAEKAMRYNFATSNRDALTHIVDNFLHAFRHIGKSMREKMIRENVITPISKVKEINTVGINWLSRKPGTTVRQKLSNGYKMMAVNRRLSLDTGENRLFLALLRDLEIYLTHKFNCLPNEKISAIEKEFYQDLIKTLRDDDLSEIHRWENLAPNNTLLSDRFYRNAWNTWLSIHKLDDMVNHDNVNIEKCLSAIVLVNFIAAISRYCRLPQIPVLFNYDEFDIQIFDNKISFTICNNSNTVTISLKSKNANWRSNDRGNFCVINVEGYGKTAIYQSYFKNQSEFSIECDNISFEIEENKKRSGEYIAKNIVVLSIPAESLIKNMRKPYISAEIAINDNEWTCTTENTQMSIKFDNNFIEVFHEDMLITRTEVTPENFSKIVKLITRLSMGAENKPLPPMAPRKVIKGKEAVIEIYSVRPKYALDNNEAENFPVKLLLLHYKNGDEVYPIPIGNANALMLNNYTDIISVRNIFESGSFQNAAYFVRQIKNELDVENLVYIIPDMFNEFQVTTIRKNVKLCYTKSLAFPKSMGLVFQWQFSDEFSNLKFSDGDFVLVVDLIDDSLTYTLIQGKFSSELLNAIPETFGYVWERYPTDTESCAAYLKSIESLLIRCGCDEAEQLINVLRVDGILRECDNLSVESGNKWFHVTSEICDKIKNTALNIRDKINEYVKLRKLLIGNGKVHVLLGTKTLKADTAFTFHSDSSIDGYRAYAAMQEKVELPLWCDHIPALAIKQLYDKFELLKNIRIEPKFGKKHNFEIQNLFTLTAGSRVYKFPLIIGDEVSEAQYEATLKSSAFPLKENIVCRLNMTYEYGIEEPYTLIFEPLNKKEAGFNSVKAEWEKIEKYDVEGLPFPKFPSIKGWETLQHYPSKDGSSSNDLLDWVSNILKEIGAFKLEKVSLKSQNAYWRTDRNGKYKCEVYVDNYGFTTVREDFFDNIDEFSQDCDVIYFWLAPDKYDSNKFIAKNIRLNYNPYNDFLSKFYISSLFAFHTVFFNARKVDELDCPNGFRNVVKDGVNKLFEAYRETTVKENKSFYFSLLCLMSGNYPIEICNIAEQYLNEHLQDNTVRLEMLALALGNCEHQEQKNLFNKLYSLFTTDESIVSILIPILSNALWKNEKLIFNLDYATMLEYFKKSVAFVSLKVNELSKQTIVDKRISRTIRHLEFMLAVFRLREVGYTGLNYELSFNNKYVRQAYAALETLTRIVIENDIEIKSFVQIQVDKSEQYENVPNLLFALLVYITGSNGEGEIIISGIDSEDD